LLAIPIVVLSLGFEAIETSLLEAAATLRADEAQVLRTVILPMILPYVLTAFAFCVVLSMNEYVISLMTIGFTHETVPIRIYNALRYGYSPVLAAVAILFMAINVVIFGLVARLSDLPKLLGAFDR
jgi:putative spermidine/putrescine transport system permease protein